MKGHQPSNYEPSNPRTLKLLLLLENKIYSWRWRLAQFLELRWWRRYLRRLDWEAYVEDKRRHWRKVLTLLDVQLAPGERVLDAGCGPAGIFTLLHEQKVDALDPLLEKYEKKLPGFQLDKFPHVHFQQLMLEQLEVKETYDLIFCMNAINHVADLDLALGCLVQALKPNGTLVLSVDVHRHSFFKFIFRLIPGDVLHPQQDDVADYQLFLDEQGLQVEKTLVLKKGWVFDYVVFKARKR
ncbi:Methyltransferase type 11 [Haliscomenobacter hydrossis DSM 1100]|uniref:Methyltransferase type 11 n=1 Tax=Haliscomenobacter hydrossis (strain ATCC 27775 / DSM 1100 / LMG 10767 / O) TaxID=760192 RepID=F4KX47_HALH1|nr:Methyltransferase type 11 [Haliscomenobacter hydrossis DSM 1100]